MVNRRNFLKSASFLTLGGLVAGKAEALQAATPVRTETTAKKSIGLQKYQFCACDRQILAIYFAKKEVDCTGTC